MRIRISAVARQSPALALALAGNSTTDGYAEITPEDWASLKRRHETKDVSPSNWPIWARIVSRHRSTGDRGVGDTLEHWLGLIGPARMLYRAYPDGSGRWALGDLHVWHFAVFGTLRWCAACPARWNSLYPYT